MAAGTGCNRYRARLERERDDLQIALKQEQERIRDWYAEVDEALDLETSFDRESLVGTYNQHRQRLKSILQSLDRIRDGTFGICEGCSNPIGDKRLQVLPSARYCVFCQGEMEQSRTS